MSSSAQTAGQELRSALAGDPIASSRHKPEPYPCRCGPPSGRTTRQNLERRQKEKLSRESKVPPKGSRPGESSRAAKTRIHSSLCWQRRSKLRKEAHSDFEGLSRL